MKVVILAGGRGTRISEESHLRPKPMIEIGGKPILWHIMKGYAQHGLVDFVICLGYRGYMIKEYFANYFLHGSDVTVDMRTNQIQYHDVRSEPWNVTLVDTGEATMTGGRVLRVRRYLDDDEDFCLTYGDGLADIDVAAQIRFHQQQQRLVTMTVVRPPARFGRSVVDGGRVVAFEEKPQAAGGLINGGFFVLSPAALDLIEGDETPWESTPLQKLVAMDQLSAWEHAGFWQPMDTLREKELLEELWRAGRAPWKTWD
ncbi:MAG: glucose-1-phosphate cytidylyltransferase [Actinomycetota bacterium]|nr:glucose-1-phosphate cytidylyltransferase [Actinomycetota bacterium]